MNKILCNSSLTAHYTTRMQDSKGPSLLSVLGQLHDNVPAVTGPSFQPPTSPSILGPMPRFHLPPAVQHSILENKFIFRSDYVQPTSSVLVSFVYGSKFKTLQLTKQNTPSRRFKYLINSISDIFHQFVWLTVIVQA